MTSTTQAAQVRTVTVTDIKVAAFEHRGDPCLIGNSVQRFIEWRKQHHTPPAISATFNVFYDNPATVAPEEYRLDICAAINHDVAGNDHGVVSKVIPGGRCAVLRHIGSDETLGATIDCLCSEWFPQSGEKRRDFPLYLQRVQFYPNVSANEAITDIFLPLG
jgi:AraC family transcriptional regulator